MIDIWNMDTGNRRYNYWLKQERFQLFFDYIYRAIEIDNWKHVPQAGNSIEIYTSLWKVVICELLQVMMYHYRK